MTGKYQFNLGRKPYPDWPSAQDSFESRWSKFVAVCRLLHRDKLDYQVRLEQREGALWGVVTASGTVHHLRQSTPKTAIPDPPDLRACQARLAEAEISLSQEREAMRRYFSRWREDPESRCRAAFQLGTRLDLRRKQKTLGEAIGRIIARRQAKRGAVRIYKSSIEPDRQDYTELDAVVGGRVPRLSQLPEHEREQPYLSVIVWRYAAGTFIRPLVEAATWTQESLKLPGCSWRKPLTLPPQYKPGQIRLYQEAKAEVEYWSEMLRLRADEAEARLTERFPP